MRVLASRLRALRLRRGDQRRLAELAGVSPNTFIRWREGKGNPRLSELEELASALKVSIAYLLLPDSSETPTLPARADDETARIEQAIRRAEVAAHALDDLLKAARKR